MRNSLLKMFFKIVTVILLCTMTERREANAAISYDAVDQYVESYVAEYGKSIRIGNKERLYNEKGEETAILYQLVPNGYMVVNPDNCRIIEYSFSVNYPFVTGENNFYSGPLQYYHKNAEMFQHSLTGSLVSTNEMKNMRLGYEIGANLKAKSNLYNLPAMLSMRSVNYSLGTALRTFDYNPDSRCGSVAASILFAYYDDAVDSNMVSTYLLSDSSGKRFSDYLKPHIEDLDGVEGSNTSDLTSGMEWYISNVGLYNTYCVYSVINANVVTYVNCVNLGRPVIVDLDAHPTYNEHWVVGYGYQYNRLSDENTMFVIVNDGWGNNGIYINWSYVGDLVYLNKPD